MDTKSKKSKPFLAWLCFFLGINILVAMAAFGVLAHENLFDYRRDIEVFISGDYKESFFFKLEVAKRFDTLVGYLASSDINEPDTDRIHKVENNLSQEGQNMIYWAFRRDTKIKATNLSQDPVFEGSRYDLPDGYDYYLYFDGQVLQGIWRNQAFDVHSYQKGYKGLIAEEIYNGDGSANQLAQTQILLAVRKDLEKTSGTTSQLYENYKRFLAVRWMIYAVMGLGALGFLLLVIALINRKSKRSFDQKLAQAMSHIWLDIKLLLSFFTGFTILYLSVATYNKLLEFVVGSILILSGCWWFYILLIDLYYNRRQFFTHNLLNWSIEQYRLLERGKPFKKALLMRAYTLLLIEAALIILAIILPLSLRRVAGLALFAFFFLIALGVYLIYRYLKRYARTLDEMGQIMDQIEYMRQGNLHSELVLPAESDFYSIAQNLCYIQEGISKATDERLKSERMKVELITNMSHDLKTPLTSIISYVELLAREEDLSERARDYISVLSQKSEKLKILIQDIFDFSKANSGALVLEEERLDLSKLIRQTLAEMEEEVAKTGLSIRARYPEIPIYIIGDGKKLYRVFQNLLTNIFKYSLEGSRVYIDIIHDTHEVTVTLKNIASYEMNFLESEMTERFVRGDRSRTTEGSGLGLAIAKSYVEAMHGNLRIKVDGDLFKVKITFPVYWTEEASEPG